jgi:hypothetical protein
MPAAAAQIARLRDDLLAEERRIVVAGAFKTGKSALLNALLAAPVLPVRARQPSRRITEIHFGDVPRASLTLAGSAPAEIPFDSVRDAVLTGNAADMVRIEVPVPLLASGCVLVDTPGIGEDPERSAAAIAAVERADLSIFALAADKILSAAERAAAAEITALLGGNVIYAVNRLDLIEPEDRPEILEWTRTVVGRSRSALIGESNVFETVARAREGASGADELRAWLSGALASGLLDRIAAVSRLARLERVAAAAATTLGGEAARARGQAEEMARRHAEQMARDRAERARVLETTRFRLTSLLSELEHDREEHFVEQVVEDTATRRETERGGVPLQVRGAMDAWSAGVTSEVHEILSETPIAAPRFSLEDWIVRIQVEHASDTPDAIGGHVGEAITRVFDGGKAGRETGAAIGKWIGKTVLGVDAEAERRKPIERAARSLVPSLRAETERYLARVVVLLEEAEWYQAAREETDPQGEAAQDEAERAAALYHWAGTLVQQAGALMNELSRDRAH